MQASRIAEMFTKASRVTRKGKEKEKSNDEGVHEQPDSALKSVEEYLAQVEAHLNSNPACASEAIGISDLLRNKTPNDASLRLASAILTADASILRQRNIVLQGPVPLHDRGSMTILQLAGEAMKLTNEGAEPQSDGNTADPDTRSSRGVVILSREDELLIVAIETTPQGSLRHGANFEQSLVKVTAYLPGRGSNLRSAEWIQALLTVMARSTDHSWMRHMRFPLEQISIQSDERLESLCSTIVFALTIAYAVETPPYGAAQVCAKAVHDSVTQLDLTRGILGHIYEKIQDDNTSAQPSSDDTLSPLPGEGPNGNIPCRNSGCRQTFKTYERANDHASRPSCKHKPGKGMPCGWATILHCDKRFDTTAQRSSHELKHQHYGLTPYPCRNSCGRRYPDYYRLTAHEVKCKKGRFVPEQEKNNNVVRLHNLVVSIDTTDKQAAPPAVIIAARASNDAPKSWKAGKGSIDEGLPQWAHSRLQEYSNIFADTRTAAIVASDRTRTYLLPAPSSDAIWYDQQDSNHDRGMKRNAYAYTVAIQERLDAAPSRPTLVSCGVDGWGANTDRIRGFLERSRTFDLVICTEGPKDFTGPQLSDGYLIKGKLFWWARYKSEDILEKLQGSFKEGHTDAALDDLVSTWVSIQGSKDSGSANHLQSGRNKKIKPSHTAAGTD